MKLCYFGFVCVCVCFIFGYCFEKLVFLLFVMWIVIQFFNLIWIENIVVWLNGDFFIIEFFLKFIFYIIVNFVSLVLQVCLFCDFFVEEFFVEGLIGIVEVLYDVFVFVGGNMINFLFYVWSVNFIFVVYNFLIIIGFIIKKIVEFKDVKFFNGVVIFFGFLFFVLIVDFLVGLVWCLDILIGKFIVVVQIFEMGVFLNEMDFSKRVGINGIKVYGGFLYFSNSNLRFIYRVKIRKDGI